MGAAEIVAAGTGNIQRALAQKGEYQASLGAGIASGVGQIGVGLFNAAQRKREEDDTAAVDSAYSMAIGSGRPEDLPKVMGAVAGTLKTPKGKAYLAKKLGESYGVRGDALDLQTKEMKLKREKQEPARSGLIRRAMGGEDVTGEADALGDASFTEKVGGLFQIGQQRKVQLARDQQAEAKAKAEEDAEGAATSIATHFTSLADTHPGILHDYPELTRRMNQLGIDASMQERVLKKFGVGNAIDQRETNAQTKEADFARKTKIQAIRDRGHRVELDEAGEPIDSGIPSAAQNERDARAKDREKRATERDSAAALRADREKRANAAHASGDRKTELSEIKGAQDATKSSLSAVNERIQQASFNGDDPDPQDLTDQQTYIKDVAKWGARYQGMVGDGKAPPPVALEPPPEGEGEYDDTAAKAAGATADATGHMTSKFKAPWNSRRILEVDGKLLDTMNDRPASKADVLDAAKQAAAHGRQDTVDYLRKVYDKWFKGK